MGTIPSWVEYENQVLPKNIPDVARDAARKSFFNDKLWSKIKEADPNANYSTALKLFLEKTERKDKSSFPHIEATAQKAAAGLVSIPFLAMEGLEKATGQEDAPQSYTKQLAKIREMSSDRDTELERQGKSTILSDIAGEIIGAAPLGFGTAAIAKTIGKKAAGKILDESAELAVKTAYARNAALTAEAPMLAAAQAGYAAAREAPNARTNAAIKEGLLAGGFGAVSAMIFSKSLKNVIGETASINGKKVAEVMDDADAEDLTNVINGTISPTHPVAQKLNAKYPGAGQQVFDFFQLQFERVKAQTLNNNVVKLSPAETKMFPKVKDKITIDMEMPSGQIIRLGAGEKAGISATSINVLVTKMAEFAKAGAVIRGVQMNEKNLNKVMDAWGVWVDKSNKYAGKVEGTGTVVGSKPLVMQIDNGIEELIDIADSTKPIRGSANSSVDEVGESIIGRFKQNPTNPNELIDQKTGEIILKENLPTVIQQESKVFNATTDEQGNILLSVRKENLEQLTSKEFTPDVVEFLTKVGNKLRASRNQNSLSSSEIEELFSIPYHPGRNVRELVVDTFAQLRSKLPEEDAANLIALQDKIIDNFGAIRKELIEDRVTMPNRMAGEIRATRYGLRASDLTLEASEELGGLEHVERVGNLYGISRKSQDAVRRNLFHETTHALLDSTGMMTWSKNFVKKFQSSTALENEFKGFMKAIGVQGYKKLDPHSLFHEATAFAFETVKFAPHKLANPQVNSFVRKTLDYLEDQLIQAGNTRFERVLADRYDYIRNLYDRGPAQIVDSVKAFRMELVSHNSNGFKVKNIETGETHFFDNLEDLNNFAYSLNKGLKNVENVGEQNLLGLPNEFIPPKARKIVSEEITDPAYEAMGENGMPLESVVEKLNPLHRATFWVKPFYSWLDTFTRESNLPQLYEAVGVNLKHAVNVYERNIAQWGAQIKATGLHKIKPERRKALSEWFQAPDELKGGLAEKLKITDSEIETFQKVRKLFDEGYGYFGIEAPYVKDYMMRMQESENIQTLVRKDKRYSKETFDWIARHKRRKELDITQRDPLVNIYTYFKLGERQKILAEPIKHARKLVNAVDENGLPILGEYTSYFNRHLDMLRGRQDGTFAVMQSVLVGAGDYINKGIRAFNQKLPFESKLPELHFDEGSLSRLLTYSYAATLGGRVVAPIRDGLTFLVTGLPVLGAKHTALGMKTIFGDGTFSALVRGDKNDAVRIANDYGALMFHNPIKELAGSEVGPVAKKLEQASEWLMKPYELSNNINRLMTFWGAAGKVEEAYVEFVKHQNISQFLSDSGMWFLDKSLQDHYLKQLPKINSNAQVLDFSRKVATELTEAVQWNYNKGAAPGMYKYAAGRIFGQYGTWPMNYIDYAKKLSTRGSVSDRAKAMTYYALAHGALVVGGEAAGIDTSTWVFSQPGAYAGGPVASLVLNGPTGAFDWQTYKGDEARREILRTPTVFIPGGVAMSNLIQAVNSEKYDGGERLYKLLGFIPYDKKKEPQGIHYLSPLAHTIYNENSEED